jgi:hypothetical protein
MMNSLGTSCFADLALLAVLQSHWLGNPHAVFHDRFSRPLLCPVEWKAELLKLVNLIGERQAHTATPVVHGHDFKHTCGTIRCYSIVFVLT